DAGDPMRVTCASADGVSTVIHSRFVLDCSGRTGIVARRGWRRADARYGTLAIAAEWECPDWPEGERTQTLVESYPDGWAWSVPLSATRRQCTVMIERRGDPKPPSPRLRRSADALREGGKVALHEQYGREIAHTTELRSRLECATRVAAPWACDASIYDCTQAAGDGVLLVGDAASFIEPLSSAGVKKALLSAWRAAVVTNTVLKHPSRGAGARDLYSQREREVHADAMRQSGSFFAEAASAYSSSFWSVRA